MLFVGVSLWLSTIDIERFYRPRLHDRPSLFIHVLWGNRMSIHTQQQKLLRVSLRLFAVLAVLASMFTMNQSTVLALPCATACPSVVINNCTTMAYSVQFTVCCNGVASPGPIVIIPAPVAPALCSVMIWPAPTGCRIIGVSTISTIPPGTPFTWNFNFASCTLNIP